MSKSFAQKRIVGMTDHSVRIRWDRLGEVLTQEEKIYMNKILGRLIEYDEGKLKSS